MNINAKDVMQLRKITGAPMMTCKKALEEVNGNMDDAVDLLRKKGAIKAADKSTRQADEGKIFIKILNNQFYYLILNSETDFVAQNEEFKKLGNTLLEVFIESPDLLEEKSKDLIADAVLKLGENILIKKVEMLEGKNWGYYLHSNEKIGAIIEHENLEDNVVKDVCMHITATSPLYLQTDDFSEEDLQRERDIAKEQVQSMNKPQNILDNIVEGKIKKYKEENALLTQDFVKDPSKKIKDILNGGIIYRFIKLAV